MPQNVSSYMKNVGKSFGYIMGDIFQEYNPVLTSLAKETKETASSMYDSIKSFTYEKPTVDEKALKGGLRSTIDDAWNNIKDDLKTGTFYNKARSEAVINDLSKSFMGDLDFDFDMDDWGDLEDEESSASIISASNNAAAKEVISAVDQVGYQIADSISNATVESADYIVRSSRRDNRALYSLNQRGFSQVTASLLAVNNSIASFAKIGEPLTAHMQNSSVFFTKTTETLNRMDQTLQQIAKNTTPPPLASRGNYNTAKGTLDSVLSDGALSIDFYKQMVRENLSDTKELFDSAMEMLKGFKSEDGSYGKNISLLSMGSKALVKAMIPKIMKESMQGFNDSLKYALTASLVEARNKSSGNILVELMKDIFLPKDGYKSTINTANYEKNQVAWDGIARKALVEVIPEYLSGIYRVLSGEDKVYDYNSGKFMARAAVKDKFNKEKSDAAKEAAGEFREDALKIVEEMANATKEQKTQIKSELESYFLKAFTKGSGYRVNEKGFNPAEFGLTEESLAVLNQLLNKYATSGDRSIRNRQNKFIANIALGRDEFGNRKRLNESKGTDTEIYLQNGFSSGSGRAGLTDEYNHSATFYLQGIYQYTGYLADNIAYIGGRSNKVNKRKKMNKGSSFDNIVTPESQKHAGEKSVGQSNLEDAININSYKDEDDRRTEEREKLYKDAKEQGKTTYEKIKNAFGKLKPGNILGFLNRPFDAAANLLNNLSDSMNQVFWGDGESDRGLAGRLFDKFNNFLDENMKNLKEKMNNVFDSLFGKINEETGKREGGKFSEFGNATKENLNNAKNWMGNSIKQFLGFKKPNVDSAAYGRKVTKTGIVAVSEGELIVPSELNPFYHGSTNKREQIRKERNAINNFYGAFADGGTVGGKDSFKDKFISSVREKDGHAGGFIAEGLDALTGGFNRFIGQMFGKDDKTIDEDKKKINKISQSILKEAGDNKGAIGAGALIGGGVSLLTGAVVGPLFGAAIGGAVGLAVKSKNVQKILFGEEDENGDPKGGLLSANVSKFFKEQLPDMAGGAAVGGTAGLFMGSPVLGAILGTTVGYIKSSEKAQSFLFGEKDEKGNRLNNGLISTELQKKIKGAVPNISAGMLAGALVGPFGIVGNLMVGAGIGYLTTSKEFENYMFGEDGLAHTIKTKIIDQLDEWGHNMTNAMKAFSKNLTTSVAGKIKDLFTKKARAYQNGEDNSLLGRAIGGSINFAGNLVKGTTSFVGDRLESLNAGRRAKNLRKGYQVYNKAEKRNMFASERELARQQAGGRTSTGTFAELDSALSSAQSIEELDDLASRIRDLQDPSRMYKRNRNNIMSSFYKDISDLDGEAAERIGKALTGRKGKAGALAQLDKLGLSEEEKARYISLIESTSDSLDKAKDEKSNTKAVLADLKKRGINLSKAGDIQNALDLIENEKKNNKFSKESQTERKEEEYKTKIQSLLESMDTNIAILSGGKAATPEATRAAQTIHDQNKEIAKTATDIDDGNENTTTHIDAFGGIHTYTKDSHGNPVEATNTSEGKEANKFMNTFKNSISSIPFIGGAIGGLTGAFSSFKNSLIGSEEKPGLLSKIAGFLGGDSGPLSWLVSLIGGTKIGSLTKSMVSSITPESIGINVVGPALLAMATAGKFDSFFTKITNGAYGSGSKNDINYNYETGETVTKDANGNYVDANGNIVDASKVKTRAGDVSSFSDRLKYNTARGIVTGTSSVASKVLGRTAIGKSVTGFASTFKNAVGSADDIAGMAARMNLSSTVSDGFAKFASVLKKVPGCSAIADRLDDIGLALAKKVTNAAASESAESIAKFAANAVIWAKVAFIAIDFTTGYEDARTTLGIIDEPTVPQKIISGLLRAVKNFIPIVGTLIPDSAVIDVFCEYIAPVFGINPSELMKQREQAQETVNAYNQEHGTNYSVGEYNKAVLKDYTWTERIGNAAKSTWNDTKNKASNIVNGIKEKGFGGYVKDTASNLKNTFMESYSQNGGGVFGAFNAIGDTLQNILPGVFGEVAKKNNEILAYASQGQLSEMWKVSLSDFSSDTEAGEASVGIFSKIIGQIPLIVTKVAATPAALISKVVKPVLDKVGDFFSGIKDDASYLIHLPETVSADTQQILQSSDSSLSDFFNISKYQNQDKNGLFNGLTTAVAMTSKILTVGAMVLKKVTKPVGDFFKGVRDKAVSTFETLNADSENLKSIAMEGGISSIGKMFGAIKEETDDPENPVGAFRTISLYGTALNYIPLSITKGIGNSVSEIFSGIKETTTSDISTYNTAVKALKNMVDDDSSSISDIWGQETKFSENGLFTKFFEFGLFLQKIFSVISKVGGSAIDSVSGFIDKASAFGNGIKEGAANIATNAKDSVYNWANDKFQAAKSWISGSGSGVDNSGFVSQYNSQYKDISYAGSTVAQKGCAPAVASMVANKYGRKLSMNEAIKLSSGYQNENGTSADYFKSALGSQGIGTQYLSGNISQQVMQNLANGKPVILLGKDASNTSKENSPFGPNSHYVLATGIDSNGNIIINDPEGNGPKSYSASILNSATVGIGTSSGAGVGYDNETSRRVWGFFTSNGYSPAATAGIMANLQQESGMDPSRVQTGSGHAAGIAQWESYKNKSGRWLALNNFAQQNGYNWSDLDPQLAFIDKELQGMDYYFNKDTNIEGYSVPSTTFNQFKCCSDPMDATKQFEKAFERAGKPNLSKRLVHAEEFFKLYQDSAYTGNYSADSPNTGEVASSNSGNSNKITVGGILGAISTAFNKLGKIFNGGTDETASIDESSGSTVSESTGTGAVTGDPTGISFASSNSPVSILRSIAGKLKYSMDGPRNPEKGSADCSSTVRWAIKKAGGPDIGDGTPTQYNDNDLQTVWYDNGRIATKLPDNIKPNDILFFSRPNSSFTQGRQDRVGHVEIYTGDGRMIGHGSDGGPKEKAVPLGITNNGGLIKVSRVVGLNNTGSSVIKNGTTMSASGSNIIPFSTRYSDLAKASGGSSGLLLTKNPGAKAYRHNDKFNISAISTSKSSRNYTNSRFNVSGGASDLAAQSTMMLNNVKSNVLKQGSSGSISADLVQRLIQSITDLLNMIANNTAPIEKIYQVLAAYTTGSSTIAETVSEASNKLSSNKTSKEAPDIDASITNLVGTLAEIARG